MENAECNNSLSSDEEKKEVIKLDKIIFKGLDNKMKATVLKVLDLNNTMKYKPTIFNKRDWDYTTKMNLQSLTYNPNKHVEKESNPRSIISMRSIESRLNQQNKQKESKPFLIIVVH